jgi:hypothetical protein
MKHFSAVAACYLGLGVGIGAVDASSGRSYSCAKIARPILACCYSAWLRTSQYTTTREMKKNGFDKNARSNCQR